MLNCERKSKAFFGLSKLEVFKSTFSSLLLANKCETERETHMREMFLTSIS